MRKRHKLKHGVTTASRWQRQSLLVFSHKIQDSSWCSGLRTAAANNRTAVYLPATHHQPACEHTCSEGAKARAIAFVWDWGARFKRAATRCCWNCAAAHTCAPMAYQNPHSGLVKKPVSTQWTSTGSRYAPPSEDLYEQCARTMAKHQGITISRPVNFNQARSA